MSSPRDPLPDYPNAEQVYAYSTQGVGGPGYPGEYGGWGSGYPGGWGGFGPGSMSGGSGAMSIADTRPRVKPDWASQQVLATSSWSYAPSSSSGLVLAKDIDDLMRAQGPGAYALMGNDPVVHAATELVVLGILGDRQEVVPRIVPEPGERVDDAVEGDRKARLERAKKYADECGRMIAAMRRPFRESLRQTIHDKVVFGSSLAELDRHRVKDGQDKGRLFYGAAIAKPFNAWAPIVDGALEPQAIWGWTPGGPVVLDIDKFLLQAWCPQGGDPRGTSIRRPAYDPWLSKTTRRIQRAKHLDLFANPTPVIKYDANNVGQPQYPLGPDGLEDRSQDPLATWQIASGIAANIHSASYMVVPLEWVVEFLEAQNDGGAFDAADAADDKQITQAILLSSRSTQESEHGSKADSEGAVDWAKMRLDYGRQSTCEDVERQLLYRYVRDNYGKAEADELSPKFSIADAHQGQRADLITAYGSVGWKPTPRQFAFIDGEIGLPVRSADEIDEAESAAKALAEAAAAPKPQAAQPGKPPAKDGGQPKPKVGEPSESNDDEEA